MPRSVLSATQTTRAGTQLPAGTAGDVVNGQQVPNSGNTLVMVKNGGASPYVATIHIRQTVEGKDVPEMTKTLAAGETWVFGPYPRDKYGDDLWLNSDNAALLWNVIEPGTT